MIKNKQLYRAIKYVWRPEWIGDEAYKAEILAAQQACCSDIVMDYQQDCTTFTQADVNLTISFIKKYGQCTIQNINDRYYMKVILEVTLQPK